jgi:hypothetical protein
MAFCVITTNPNGSAELFERVGERIRENGEFPPEGAVFQVAGAAPDGWKVISVWESRDAFERFRADRLRPALAEAGADQGDVSFMTFEAHSYMAGTPSGAAQVQ